MTCDCSTARRGTWQGPALRERPFDRLLQRGPAALTDGELLGLLLDAGEHSGAQDVEGERVLSAMGGLDRLARAGLGRLAEAGLGPARAALLIASFELGRRGVLAPKDPSSPIDTPSEAARFFVPILRPARKEVFALLCLDTKARARGVRQVSIGTLSASMVHPREVFAEAIQEGAASVVVAHNHPSGDPTPSPEDESVTHRLVQAGDLLGIPVLDHLIVGSVSVVSLKELGMLRPART